MADVESRYEAKDFLSLFKANWTTMVSSYIGRQQKEKSLNQAQDLPLAEDVSKYQKFLEFRIEELLQLDILSATDQKLLKIFLLFSILTFNRGRTSEVHFLTFVIQYSWSQPCFKQIIESERNPIFMKPTTF